MSLLRLLTVGRSLGLIRDQPSRYKMTQQTLLPKFGSTKPTDAGESERQETLKAAEVPPVESKNSQAAASDAKPAKAKKIMKNVEAEISAPVKQAYPQGRWTVFRNPFGFVTSRPKVVQAPVQCELSLESVKPVRNDLSDSDLEVVRINRPEPVASVPPSAVVPETPLVPPVRTETEAEPPVWNRITAQFFGAGKS
jgi:hypothetical protein